MKTKLAIFIVIVTAVFATAMSCSNNTKKASIEENETRPNASGNGDNMDTTTMDPTNSLTDSIREK
jgi:hypothetical protein